MNEIQIPVCGPLRPDFQILFVPGRKVIEPGTIVSLINSEGEYTAEVITTFVSSFEDIPETWFSFSSEEKGLTRNDQANFLNSFHGRSNFGTSYSNPEVTAIFLDLYLEDDFEVQEEEEHPMIDLDEDYEDLDYS